jgi:hypothetical protein
MFRSWLSTVLNPVVNRLTTGCGLFGRKRLVLLSTLKLTKGLNIFERSNMSLRSDSSFFYGMNGKFTYFSRTI